MAKKTTNWETVAKDREVLARVKDVLYTLIKPEAEYMGETIDLSGDGNITEG